MRYQVTTTLRSGIKDNAGDAVLNALHSLGFDSVKSVRIGRRFEFKVDGRKYFGEKLSKLVESQVNLIMETYTIEKLK